MSDISTIMPLMTEIPIMKAGALTHLADWCGTKRMAQSSGTLILGAGSLHPKRPLAMLFIEGVENSGAKRVDDFQHLLAPIRQ